MIVGINLYGGKFEHLGKVSCNHKIHAYRQNDGTVRVQATSLHCKGSDQITNLGQAYLVLSSTEAAELGGKLLAAAIAGNEDKAV
jgi:hypothetical protein